MSHSHTHDRTSYYVEQLCTIGICGMLGGVTIMLYYQNLLRFIIAAKFHAYVLWGGIALLVLVVIRAVSLWVAVGRLPASTGHETDGDEAHMHWHEHEHGPGEDCGHDHHHAHEHGHHHSHGEHAEVITAEINHHGHAHAEPHDHGDDNGHEHTPAGADHGHDHGWNPWRYVVLLLPIVLYFLHLPNAGFTSSYSGTGVSVGDLGQGMAGNYVENTGLQIAKHKARDLIQVVAVIRDSPAEKAGISVNDFITQISATDADGKPLAKPETVAVKGLSVEEAAKKLRGKPQTKVKLTIEREGDDKSREIELTRALDVLNLAFQDLNDASYTPAARKFYQGRIVRLKGQYKPSDNERLFSLVRYKITCCAADAITLNLVIMLDPQSPSLPKIKADQWVEVTGQIEFRKRRDRDEYVTVLKVPSAKDVQEVEADANPYLQ